MPVSASLSGLPGDFNIPTVPGSGHIDGVVQNGLFNDTVVAEPGFGRGQRALLSGVELLGLGSIEGATRNQLHLGSSSAPEPGSLTLILGLLPVVFFARRRMATRKAS